MINADIETLDPTAVEIRWTGVPPGLPVSIFYGTSVEEIDRENPVAVSESCPVRISGLDPLNRYFFEISADGRSVVSASRRVIMDGAVNFRDLGGYLAEDGRRVKWGRVYRSDGLARLSDRDVERIRRMGIKCVFDLRSADEINEAPDRLPDDRSVAHVHIPVTHGEFDFVEAMHRIKRGDTSWLTDDFMIRGYINNIESFPRAWGRIIKAAADMRRGPVLFHCTGGKDRTGTCAALILLALGVDEDTVIEDHQLSNIYIKELLPKIYEMMAGYGIDPETLFPYLTAPRECIAGLIDYIRDKYGTAVDYLVQRAGLTMEDIELLRQSLLVETPLQKPGVLGRRNRLHDS